MKYLLFFLMTGASAMDFTDARLLMKEGNAVTREAWPEEMYIQFIFPTEATFIPPDGIPYGTVLTTSEGIPWMSTIEDLLADDWKLKP
jgi:hypothetical protein